MSESQTERLIAVLTELSTLLEDDSEHHWREWALDARDRLAAADYSGIERWLAAYGGMGSFTDLVLGPNNSRLAALRTQAWELANSIKSRRNVHGA
jgi:hypothetical protein